MKPHRPLTPAAQAVLDEAVTHVAALPAHLVTPTQWAQAAMTEAVALAGNPEAAEKAAECRRYLACAEIMLRLSERCAALEQQLGEAESMCKA